MEYYLIVIFLYIVFHYGLLYYMTMKHKNYEKRKVDKKYYLQTAFNLFTSIIVYYFIYIYREKLFVGDWSFNLKNIIFYFLFIDTILYWSHRLTHRVSCLKELVHSLHHNLRTLLPLDFTYLTIFDYNLYFLVDMLIPLFFINVSYTEYCCIVGVIYWQSMYIHSDVNFKFPIPGFIHSKYHKRHHEIGGGNYGQYFPIWDEYMGTKIKRRLPKKYKL
jgi:sterol desaturase/sphingolipid hydroxylase (fatty acid hydroxylase superfamily)